jgi:hypothetical protein
MVEVAPVFDDEPLTPYIGEVDYLAKHNELMQEMQLEIDKVSALLSKQKKNLETASQSSSNKFLDKKVTKIDNHSTPKNQSFELVEYFKSVNKKPFAPNPEFDEISNMLTKTLETIQTDVGNKQTIEPTKKPNFTPVKVALTGAGLLTGFAALMFGKTLTAISKN